jgi:hypothetical protein
LIQTVCSNEGFNAALAMELRGIETKKKNGAAHYRCSVI